MTLRVRFFAQFRERHGADHRVEPSPGASVADVVRNVAGTGEGEDAAVDSSGRLREFVILMLNGRRLDQDEAEETAVRDGDEIAVFPPVAGG